jgi:hypothetical protein
MKSLFMRDEVIGQHLFEGTLFNETWATMMNDGGPPLVILKAHVLALCKVK